MSNIQKNNKPNVPNLRFPEFSGEWEKRKLASIGKFFSGGTPTSSNKDYYDGEIPFIRSGEIHSDHTELSISAIGYENSSAKMVSKGDLLLALYGATSGDIAISRMSGAINQAILCIRTTQDQLFFKSVWEKHVKNILNTYLQGGQGNLSADIVKNLFFYFPGIEEQRKIGRLIELIDQRIAIQNRIIEDLKKLKTALEDTCFYNCGGKQVCLRDILVERGERSNRNNQYEVLSSTVEGIYSQREYFKKEIASADNAGYKVIHLGDIVLSPQNLWMGNINYNDRFSIGIVSPSYKVFSIKPTFDEQFVASILKTKRALWKYSLVSEQGASIVRRNLNMKDFYEISFAIPSLEKQRRIGEGISSIRDIIRLEQSYLNILNSHKSYLLSKMFI